MSLLYELKLAARSLWRAKGLSLSVVLTLALGIGANAAIFTVVRGVLLRPLVNRDEARLVYVRQSAPGIGAENAYFSVPEIADLRAGSRTLTRLGEFSTMRFTMVGLGEPRQVSAGVVDGGYFDVMGLRPVLGRLLGPGDDGPSAAGAAVLTHRFWTSALGADPAVVGRTIRLDSRMATVVGVLEPSVPYPTETELIANVVTSPHHLSATMVTGREHRMTELFGRLAPAATLDGAKAELRALHAAMAAAHPEAYVPKADFRVDAVSLRDQITSRARTILLILLACSALIFIVACSNAANLILARAIRRESELAMRAALGASTARLRRTLLAESLLLAFAGGLLGLAIAGPMVGVLARSAARFTERASELTIDYSIVWVGMALATIATLLFAFVPRLPAGDAATAAGVASTGARATGSTTRRLRLFATTQVAASFVLLAGASLLARTLLVLQATDPGFDTENVLAVEVPVSGYGRTPQQVRTLYREIRQQTAGLPGVVQVAVGGSIPWRDTGGLGSDFAMTVEGIERDRDDSLRGNFRSVSPGFFAALGIPLLAGRDFTDDDRDGAERVVIVSEALARSLFPGQDPINRRLWWSDPVMKFIDVSPEPRRIVGVARDIDDERLTPIAELTVYHPFDQEVGNGRLFVHATGNPRALTPGITKLVRELAADQPVEGAATLEDIRIETLAPTRMNAVVVGVFAAVALAIALVGVAGVLMFSVSGRTREFGIRLALGSAPRALLGSVLREGALIGGLGVAAGGAIGLGLARLVGGFVPELSVAGPLPLAVSAALLVVAATVSALIPALRAARVDVLEALRVE